MISLAYYLRVIAAVWMRPEARPNTEERRVAAAAMPAIAGGSPEADAETTGSRCWVIVALAALAAGATVFFGIVPSPSSTGRSTRAPGLTGLIP